MAADDHMHGADNSVSIFAGAGGMTQRHAQRCEEAKPTSAITEIAIEKRAPALASADVMSATFGRLTHWELRFEFTPVDIAGGALKTWQHEDTQMLGHRVSETDELRPAGQKQLTSKSRARIERQAARMTSSQRRKARGRISSRTCSAKA